MIYCVHLRIFEIFVYPRFMDFYPFTPDLTLKTFLKVIANSIILSGSVNSHMTPSMKTFHQLLPK